jgi:hypothetical protein
VQCEDDIHGGQATASYAEATSLASMVRAPPSGSNASTSMRLKPHKLDNVICEEGWEPAKLHRRKKQDSEVKTIEVSHQSTDKSMGSVFFRSKMEGRCFNCFSPNHLACSCHRPSRCWKCYHSGHRAMDCTSNSWPAQHKRVIP